MESRAESELAIRVERLSKLFRIGEKEAAHENLAMTMADWLKSPLSNYRKYRSLYRFEDVLAVDGTFREASNVIWALRDVSFNIGCGEVVGIIGSNGAGKSTFLKVLSRITPPTTGRVVVRGRVASLLEVGTGFHNELTGRENVYLNGTVLGMKKREIDKKFDEIVAFSGVEKFLDTPVKRYSSGMRVRLAFAVAAHLDPEILIVDEVLAVGDADFQRKCIHKMQDVGSEGRTVLFVSHNMPVISRLCSRGILFEQGSVIQDGPIQEVVGCYLNHESGTSARRDWNDSATAPGGEVARLRSARVVDRGGQIAEACDIRNPIGLEMEYEVLAPGYLLMPVFYVFNEEGVTVLGTVEQDLKWRHRQRPEGRYVSTAWIPGNLLSEGMFYVTCVLLTLNPNRIEFRERHTVAFQVVDTMEGDSARGEWAGRLAGVVRPKLEWTTSYHSLENEKIVHLSGE